MTIKRKLILAFLLLILLPAFFLQMWLFRAVTRIMVENVCQAESNALNSTIKETKNIFFEMNRILLWLSTDRDVRQLVQTEQELGNSVSKQARYEQLVASGEILDRSQLLLMKYPFDILLIPRVGNAYGNCEDLPYYAGAARETEWYRRLLDEGGNKIHWVDTVQEGLVPEQYSFYAALPIHMLSQPRETAGVAYIAISENLIWKTMQNVNPYGDAFLVNRDGYIVSARDKALLKTPVGALTDDGVLDLEQSDELWADVRVQEKEMFALHSEQISDNWRIVTFLPREIVLNRIHEARMQLLTFYVLIVLVTVGVALLLANALSRPIVRLSEALLRVEAGDLNTRVAETSQGELGVLERNFNRMVQRITNMMEDLRIQEQKKTKAEIDSLQAQINPHFLFNVLSSIRWASKDEKAENMVLSLCALLKACMRRGGDVISLGEECRLLAQYVELNNLRHIGEVTFLDELPAQMRQISIPRFLLQPLVENAILHGFENTGGVGTIRLHGELEKQVCRICVSDDGCGFPAGFTICRKTDGTHRSKAALSSIALVNVLERLQLTFSENAFMQCENLMDENGGIAGAQVTLSFPLKQEESGPPSGKEQEICIRS